jgi:hypothetical protein
VAGNEVLAAGHAYREPMPQPFARVPAGLIAGLLAVTLLSACGTTVPLSAQVQASAGGDGLGGVSTPEAGAATPGGLPTEAGPTVGVTTGSTPDASLPTVDATTRAFVTKAGKPVEIGFAYRPTPAPSSRRWASAATCWTVAITSIRS